LREDTAPHLISANEDGDIFTELMFALEYKRWRADNLVAKFIDVDFGNVEALQRVAQGACPGSWL
jgi:hypothetical protein